MNAANKIERDKLAISNPKKQIPRDASSEKKVPPKAPTRHTNGPVGCK